MPTGEMSISLDSSEATLSMFGGGQTLTTLSVRHIVTSPLLLQPDQMYYWSKVWEAGEQESREDLVRGDVVTFTDPHDVMRWLFSSDDE